MAVTLEHYRELFRMFQEQQAELQALRANLAQHVKQVEDKKSYKHGHINLGKDLCPDGFDGKTSEAFKAWKVKVINYLSLDNDDNIEKMMEWAGKLKEKITDEQFDEMAAQEFWDPDGDSEHKKFSKVLYRFLMAKTTDTANRIIQNGDPGNGIDAWRRLTFQFDPNLASLSQCHLKAILAIPRAKDTNEAVANIQKLEDLIRKYEKTRDKELDEELKIQRMFDILPATIEQHLVLEHRDSVPKFEDVRRRALTWIMTHTSGKAPMIDSLNENHYDPNHNHTDNTNGTEPDAEGNYGGDVMGFKGGAKGGKGGKGGFQGHCWVCGEHGHSSKYCPHSDQKGKGKGKIGNKGGGKGQHWGGQQYGNSYNPKGKGKFGNKGGGKGQQWGGQHWGSWSGWGKGGKAGEVHNLGCDQQEEWDNNNWQMDMLSFEKMNATITTKPHTGRFHALMCDDVEEEANHVKETARPNVLTGGDILEMAKIKAKQGETKRANRNKKEALSEGEGQAHRGTAPTEIPCLGVAQLPEEHPVESENENAHVTTPPNPATARRAIRALKLKEAYNEHCDCMKQACMPTNSGINLFEKHGDKAIDNVENAWMPMPRPLVIDSGAAETVIPNNWFTNHKVEESAGSRSGVYYTTADGTPVHNEGEKTLTMCTPDGNHMRQMTFQVAAVNKALGSVSKIVNNGNRVVFDVDGSYIENKWSKDKLWLREDNGVYVLDMLVAPNNESGFGRPGPQS